MKAYLDIPSRFSEESNTLTARKPRQWLMVALVVASLTMATQKAEAQFTNINAGLPGMTYSSVAWGDYDHDGWLDLLLTGGGISQIWRNMGNGTFTNVNAGLPGLDVSSAAWGDFDNDRWIDILLAGNSPTGGLCQVWRNLCDGTFTNVNASLPGIGFTAVACGDYDNDGRLDILLAGSSAIGYVSQVWRNVGNGIFTNIGAGLPGVRAGSLAWGDYDKDGWLDILLAGAVSGTGGTNEIWRNLGDGIFTNINAGLPGIENVFGEVPTSTVWGDYDNDGWLDILFTGMGNAPHPTALWRNLADGTFMRINSAVVQRIHAVGAWGDYDNDGLFDIYLSGPPRAIQLYMVWRNLGNGAFTNGNSGIPLGGRGSVAWGDFDNDSRLDLVLTGKFNEGVVSQIWRNTNPILNTPPSSPSELTSVVSGDRVVLSWNAASDAQTPAPGLTYNVRVGTTPGGFDVVSPHADTATGFRRVPKLGNAQHRLFSILTKLPPGCYYWSVQAVDTAFAGGPFAAESSFMIGPAILLDANFGMSGGQFGFNLNWKTGSVAVVEASTNLLDWIPIWTNPPGLGPPLYFSDPQTTGHLTRFYRALTP